MLRDEIIKELDEAVNYYSGGNGKTIEQAADELESLFEKHRDDFAEKFQNWIRDHAVADGAPKMVYRKTGERMTTQELLTEFKTNHYKKGK